MKNEFSLAEARAELQGPVGAAFDLESSFEEAAAVGGLASSASAFVNSAIKCFLVGLDEPGRLLVYKAISWFSTAISNQERPRRYFEGSTEADRLYGLALAKWLAGEQSLVEVTESIEYREQYFLGKPGTDPIEVGLVLVEYLDGNRADLIKFHVDRLWGAKKLPFEVRAVLRLSHVLPSEEKQLEVVGLLRRSADDWLRQGHFDRFAKWVKIATSSQPNKLNVPVLLREMHAALK